MVKKGLAWGKQDPTVHLGFTHWISSSPCALSLSWHLDKQTRRLNWESPFLNEDEFCFHELIHEHVEKWARNSQVKL